MEETEYLAKVIAAVQRNRPSVQVSVVMINAPGVVLGFCVGTKVKK